MRFHLNRFPELESTNDWLMERYEQNHAIENEVVVAGFQSKGKGQQGNIWESAAGKNLLFSLGLRTDFLPAAAQFLVSKAVALALTVSVEELIKQKSVQIKWPNDIYVDNKKVCGVLISNIFNGNKLAYSIVGVGLNVNQLDFPNHLPNPTSLRTLTNRSFDLNKVLDLVLENFARHFKYIQQEKNHQNTHLNYLKKLYQLDEQHLYRVHGQLITANIMGLNEFGQIMLKDQSENVYTCDVKELVYL